MTQTKADAIRDVTKTVLKWPTISRPFVTRYFIVRLSERNLKQNNRPKLDSYLQNEKKRIKYVLLLLELGSHLQKSLRLLETERKVVLSKELKEGISFVGMPELKIVSKYRATFDTKVSLTDATYLAWHEAFINLLFQLSEYLHHFTVFSDTTRLPAYADVEAKFPIRK